MGFSNLRLRTKIIIGVCVPVVLLAIRANDDTAAAMGAAVGMGLGSLLEKETIDFSAAGEGGKRMLRGLLGLALVLAAYLGLSALFGLVRLDGAIEIVWRTLRYALLGLAASWGAPWVFVQIGLSTGGRDRNEG